MTSIGTSKRYHISGVMEFQSNEQLERWAADPNCIEQAECAAFLAKRKTVESQSDAVEEQKGAKPFDPRTEVSADARHIANKVVTHLWILFVALPIVLGILYSLLAH